MHLVLAAAITELLQLKTAGDGLLVLRSRVIALLALRAFQRDDFPHLAPLRVASGTEGLGTKGLSLFLLNSAALISLVPQSLSP